MTSMIHTENREVYEAGPINLGTGSDLVHSPASTGGITQFQPGNFGELVTFSNALAMTQFIPKEFMNKPNEIIAAVMYGAELGLKPMQALQSICVINGKPSVYGDTMLALIRASHLSSGQPLMIDFAEGHMTDEGGNITGAWCEALRYGAQRPVRREFTLDDAARAGLLDKSGPWKQYPARMLMFRARSWALRDTFGDVLKGMQCVEEMIDVQPITGTIEITEQPVRPTVSRSVSTVQKGSQVRDRMAQARGSVSTESKGLKSHKGFMVARGWLADDLESSRILCGWVLGREVADRDQLTEDEWQMVNTTLFKTDKAILQGVVAEGFKAQVQEQTEEEHSNPYTEAESDLLEE